jgi:hypothetical protein
MPDSTSVCDTEILTVAKTAFYEACEVLPPDRNDQTIRVEIADRILAAASKGERDIGRLRSYGLQVLEDAPINSNAGLGDTHSQRELSAASD